jgi:hypothetical protein
VSPKNIFIFLACLVLLAATFAVWLYWFSPPHVRFSTQGDRVVFENVVLAEYYLGFEEVIIRNRDSGKIIWHGRRDKGDEVTVLSFRAGLNSTFPHWTLIEPKNSETFTLSPGVDYQLIVWANNGFARINKWNGPLRVPSPDR